MSKVNQYTAITNLKQTQADITQVEKILRKAESKQKLTPQEIETFNKLAPQLRSQVGLVGTKQQVANINNAAQLAGTGAFATNSGASQPQTPPPIPTVPRLSGTAGNDATRNYERAIDQQVKQDTQGYGSLLKQQQESFTRQLTEQQNFLGQQLGTIQSQSQQQLQSYQSLLTQITQQQERELSTIREQFSRGNAQSEETIARLQKDIERLSTINRPPAFNVDTRPAVIGRSRAQLNSQKRQAQGTAGGRRSTPTAAQGLGRVGSLGLTIAT